MRRLLVKSQWLKEADKTSTWIILGRRFTGLSPTLLLCYFPFVSLIPRNAFSRKWAMGFSNFQYKMLWPIRIHFSWGVKLQHWRVKSLRPSPASVGVQGSLFVVLTFFDASIIVGMKCENLMWCGRHWHQSWLSVGKDHVFFFLKCPALAQFL